MTPYIDMSSSRGVLYAVGIEYYSRFRAPLSEIQTCKVSILASVKIDACIWRYAGAIKPKYTLNRVC